MKYSLAKPPSAAILDRIFSLTNDVQREVPARRMPHQLLQQINLKKAAVSIPAVHGSTATRTKLGQECRMGTDLQSQGDRFHQSS